MITRQITSRLKQSLRDYPSVALLGARQTGKTTLAKSISPNYFDLELESERLRLDLQWEIVVRDPRPLVLDEAQNDAAIFPRIRSAIDSDRKRHGRFLILGSVSPSLMKPVSEFLAGRIALLQLSPFSMEELPDTSADHLWLIGGYPDGGIQNTKHYPAWQGNYLDVLAMRDLPNWGLPSKPTVTARFFKMLAAAHGTLWNATQLGKSMGLSYHTVNTYLDYLEQTYLIRRLPPYSANIRKRLVKSPKIYWRDSGLLHALMNIERLEDLLVQPWVGISWEGWVIEQVLTALNNRGINYEAYFFRTRDGHEAELVLRLGRRTWVLEIKLASGVERKDMHRLETCIAMIKADKGILLSRSTEHIEGKSLVSTNLETVLGMLPKA
jgi:predicted AAA+ superfamily ATPase